MIVNSLLCPRSQGSELVIVSFLCSVQRCRSDGFVSLGGGCPRSLTGPVLSLVVSHLGTASASFPWPTFQPTGTQSSTDCFLGPLFQTFIRPAGFIGLSPDYSLGKGCLTDRHWPWRSLRDRVRGFVMAATTRTSLTIFPGRFQTVRLRESSLCIIH